MAPHDYAEWPPQSRGLAEARIVLGRSTNDFGVQIDQAQDAEFNGWWKVEFGHDYVAEAVKTARETAPEGAIVKRVYLNPDYVPTRRPGGP